MIKCERDEVKLEGKMVDILAEYMAITAALKEATPPELRGVLTKAHEAGMQLERENEKKAAEYLVNGMVEVVKEVAKKNNVF